MAAQDPHEQRVVAESFGVDAARYDKARPSYPAELVQRVLNGGPGTEVLDVGCGTGIATRLFRSVGCQVLGIDVDDRMAELARRDGTRVEISTFEEWDPAGRSFDVVIAAQSWHWVDPVLGAAKAAEALRPGGRLAPFWNVAQLPPGLADACGAVYRAVVPGGPNPWVRPALEMYAPLVTKTMDGIRRAGGFAEPEEWRIDWQHRYTGDEWLEQVLTTGMATTLSPRQSDELISGFGTAIDSVGGAFTVDYTTAAVIAVRD
ncbi:class I SAM-dependent methyltransferase [Pseudonocardiaceae bacterium YIM PH 21723]|nr:class I SAM-dependent methyltransferase [Pseudonocardiaceae bacterium YIM PH 21723]